MRKNLGYKAMLRDKMPETVDLALRWTQSKNKWIDHVYSKFIGILISKEDRNSTTRIILGLSNKGRKFDFHKTIDWSQLDSEETAHWIYVEDWVTWFQKNMLNIDNVIAIEEKTGGNKKNELKKLRAFSELDDEWKEKLINYILSNKT